MTNPYSQPEGPPVQARISFDEKETMLVYLLRHLGIFLEARQILTPDHFTETYEIIYAVLWRSTLDLFAQYSTLPTRPVLKTEVAARLEACQDELPPSAREELNELIDHIYDIDMTYLEGPYEHYGFDLLKRFLEERHWIDPMREFLDEIGDRSPADLPAILRDYSDRLSRIESVRMTTVEDLAPDGWEPEPLIKIPTGLRFLDEPMGGGWADGEVYGLLGTYGSGKTMLASQISAEAAQRFCEAARLRRCLARQVFFVTWETPPNEIRRRVISYLAHIRRDRLESTPWSETLSRAGNRQQYENDLQLTDGRGEWERYQTVRETIDNWHVLNMTGPRTNPKAGSGWIDEIQTEIEKWTRRRRAEPGLILIDYALLVVRRYITAKGWDEDRKLRHLMGRFGDECRRLLAEHFNCGVWVVNQLSGEANKKSSAATQHYADSAEAKNFAENLWYVFCLGNKDRRYNVAKLEAGKTRRSAGVAQPSILHIDGAMSRLVEVNETYMIDTVTGRIVPRQVGRMVNPEQANRRQTESRTSNQGGPSAGLGVREG